jgi:stringent starvation protein B
VRVPIGAVLGIYARETGEGMVFSESDPEPPPGQEPATPEAASANPGGEKGPPERRRPRLQVVK